MVAARQGDRDEAERLYGWLVDRGPASRRYRLYQFDRGRPSSPPLWPHSYGLAQIAAALGDRERAVELLRQAAEHMLEPVMWFHVNPYLEPLWDYPPFQELIRPKG